MVKERTSLLQIGIALLVVGILIRVLISMAGALYGLSTILVIGGIILAIVGALSPGRR